METVVHTWLPDLLGRLAARHPEVTVELRSDVTPALRDELLRGRLDLVVSAEAINEGAVDNRHLASLAMGWLAAPGLVAHAARLSAADLAALPIMTFPRGSVLHRSISRLREASETGAPALRVSVFSSIAAMIAMARAGFGVATLPQVVVRDAIETRALVALESEVDLPPLPIFASWRTDAVTPLMEDAIDLAGLAASVFIGTPPGAE